MLPTAALDFNVAIPSRLQLFTHAVFDVVIDDKIQLILGEAVVLASDFIGHSWLFLHDPGYSYCVRMVFAT